PGPGDCQVDALAVGGSTIVSAVALRANGDLWIATYGEGVYCWRKGRLYQFGRDDGLDSEDIYDLKLDPEGHIWAASDAGICLLRWREDTKDIRQINSSHGLPDDIVTKLLPHPDGGCWVGTYEGGVARCYWQDEQVVVETLPAWPGGLITSLAQVDQRSLWVGTRDQGVLVYDFQRASWRNQQHLSDPPQRILQLLFDQEGLIWVLSRDKGLCKVQPRLEVWNELSVTPQAVAVDSTDRLWVGTQEGLYCLLPDKARLEAKSLGQSLNIISLYVDVYQQLWIGTFGEGLFVFDPRHEQLQAISPSQGLSNGSILSINGRGKELWITTLGGVYRSSARPWSELSQLRFDKPVNSKQMETDFLYFTYLDEAGSAWFGTDGYGLRCLQKDGQLCSYKFAADSLPIRSVYSITKDGQNRIWISTDNQQFLVLERDTFRQANLPLTLNHGEIANLSTDKQGNVVVAHKRGVAVYDIHTEQLVDYHHLSDRHVFEPVLNAICRDSRGNLWLAGREQLVYYLPLREAYRQQPCIHLDGVSIYLRRIDFEHRHTFKASENNLIFHYDGVWLSDPEEVSYYYRLAGFDQDWIATKDNQVVYSNLPPGAYTFEVMATQSDDFSTALPKATYTFRIRYPYYLQPWFIIGAGLLLFFFFRQWQLRREYQLQREAVLHKDKVESQYETLKSQINPHFLFNSFNTLVALIEEQPRAAVTYVEKLADFYRSILQYRKQDTISLAEEMEVVQDYYFLLIQRYQDNLQLDIDELPTHCHIPPLSVQMLIENAVKHNVISRQRPLCIRIYAQDNYLFVENPIQAKLTRQKSTGLGLSNIQSRYALLCNLPVRITQHQDRFTVGLPLICE
ncbi:MAG: hypothetical protein D6772_01375, partial [Bacteroidetes bacterium]